MTISKKIKIIINILKITILVEFIEVKQITLQVINVILLRKNENNYI